MSHFTNVEVTLYLFLNEASRGDGHVFWICGLPLGAAAFSIDRNQPIEYVFLSDVSFLFLDLFQQPSHARFAHANLFQVFHLHKLKVVDSGYL